MEFEQTTMAQLIEIERLIANGLKDRRIARALKIRRTTVAAVRRGELTVEALKRLKSPVDQLPPGWTMRVDWLGVEKDLSNGHDQKRI